MIRKKMLNITKYLQTHTLDDLEKEYHTIIKWHPQYTNLVLLKYNQIETPMDNISRECRGIILDKDNNWEPVCFPYARFPNLNGEAWGDPIDWCSAKTIEKVDGSLTCLWFYDNKWNVSTSGSPDAGGSVGENNFTFANLFWKIWNDSGYQLPKNAGLNYFFELCSVESRVIVRHKKPKIVMHGARRMSDLVELDYQQIAKENGYEYAKSFPFTDVDSVIKIANELDPLEAEGFVVCDKNFHRAKVKGEKYRMMAHFRDSLSIRSLLDIARKNEGDEALIGFEEFTPMYNDLQLKCRTLINSIDAKYDKIKDIKIRKDYAKEATKERYFDCLFHLRDGRVQGASEYILNMDIKYLEGWLEIKNKKLV